MDKMTHIKEYHSLGVLGETPMMTTLCEFTKFQRRQIDICGFDACIINENKNIVRLHEFIILERYSRLRQYFVRKVGHMNGIYGCSPLIWKVDYPIHTLQMIVAYLYTGNLIIPNTQFALEDYNKLSEFNTKYLKIDDLASLITRRINETTFVKSEAAVMEDCHEEKSDTSFSNLTENELTDINKFNPVITNNEAALNIWMYRPSTTDVISIYYKKNGIPFYQSTCQIIDNFYRTRKIDIADDVQKNVILELFEHGEICGVNKDNFIDKLNDAMLHKFIKIINK